MISDSRKKIKVAFFGDDFSRKGRGTALVVQKLAEEFVDRFPDEIELVILRKPSPSDNFILKKVRSVEIKFYRLPLFSTLFSYLIFFFSYREHFDLVMFNRNVYPFFWMLNSKAFVLLLHDMSVSPAYQERLTPENYGFYIFLKYVGKYFLDAIIAVSEDARLGIISRLRARPEKVRVVYNGASGAFRKFSEQEKRDFFESLKSKYGILKPYFLTVARLDPHKNVGTLIDAFFILKREYSFPHKLVIVGGRHLPKYTKLIESKISSSDIGSEVIITPYIEETDMPALYNAADVFVFPSLMEGFGLPLVEAMKCGVPVVASDVSAMPEIAGGAAALVNATDSRLLADRIWEVYSDSALKASLVEKGLLRAKFFSWQKTAQSMKNIYESCLYR